MYKQISCKSYKNEITNKIFTCKSYMNFHLIICKKWQMQSFYCHEPMLETI